MTRIRGVGGGTHVPTDDDREEGEDCVPGQRDVWCAYDKLVEAESSAAASSAQIEQSQLARYLGPAL